MTEERPRPQFGEYASREEQLARIAAPSPEQLEPSENRNERPAAEPSKLPDPALIAASRQRFNVVATTAFLVYGLFEVVVTTPKFRDFSVLVNEQLSVLGSSFKTEFSAFPDSALSNGVGLALIAFWVALWAGAALWSWRRLRAQKYSVWIPFAAGVLANLVAGSVMLAVAYSDPVIAQQLMTAIAGGR